MSELNHKVMSMARIVVVLLLAGSLGGCATLMQAFSMQPTAALSETDSNAGSGTLGDAGADATVTAADGQWTTRVYHGWAGPSSQE